MSNRYLVGAAAGAALLAVAGATQAAELTPVTTVAPVAPPVAIQFDTTIVNDWDFDPFDAIDFDWEADLVIDFQRPGGWGFQILGIVDVYAWAGVEFDYDLGVRTYRSFGTTTLGFYAAIEGDVPCCALDDINLGMDIAFQHGNLTIANRTYANFDLTFDDINSYTALAFAVSDTVTVGGGVFVDFPGVDLELDAWVKADLGVFAPYAFVVWDPLNNDGWAGAGVDFERPLGTGPFSLIGNAEIEYSFGGGFDAEIIFGIRFNQGQINAPWWWKPLGINGADTNTL